MTDLDASASPAELPRPRPAAGCRATGAGPAIGHRSGPMLLVLGSMSSLQFGAAIATHLFPLVGAAGASALRLGLSAVILLGFGRPEVRSWSGSQRRSVVLLGLTMAAMNTAFYEAVSRIPLGAAITVEFLGPLTLAAALSRRLREVMWVVLALCGVVLLGLAQGDTVDGLDLVGVAAAAVAGIFWAGYILAGSRVAVDGPAKVGLAGACTVAAILVVPVGVAAGGTALDEPKVLGLGLAMAVLASVVPYSLELRALQRMAKRTFSILVALEPAIGALVGFSFLHQSLPAAALAGIALVIVAGIGATATAPEPEEPVLAPGSS